jgi:adenylate cyclase
MYNKMRRDAEALKDHAEELMRLSNEKDFTGWLGYGLCFRGEALAMLGQVQEGMAHIREGMAIGRSTGGYCHMAGAVGTMAEAQGKAGQPEEGLVTLAEALVQVEETDERHWEAELHRLRAELLLMKGDDAEAETSLRRAEQGFQHAIEVARRQNAKSWELRATTSLAYLWQKQGKVDEARRVMVEIYGWFAEGFDTADLKEAKALLDELA